MWRKIGAIQYALTALGSDVSSFLYHERHRSIWTPIPIQAIFPLASDLPLHKDGWCVDHIKWYTPRIVYERESRYAQ